MSEIGEARRRASSKLATFETRKDETGDLYISGYFSVLRCGGIILPFAARSTALSMPVFTSSSEITRALTAMRIANCVFETSKKS